MIFNAVLPGGGGGNEVLIETGLLTSWGMSGGSHEDSVNFSEKAAGVCCVIGSMNIEEGTDVADVFTIVYAGGYDMLDGNAMLKLSLDGYTLSIDNFMDVGDYHCYAHGAVRQGAGLPVAEHQQGLEREE